MYFPTGEYRRGGLQAVDVTVSPTQITPRPDTSTVVALKLKCTFLIITIYTYFPMLYL